VAHPETAPEAPTEAGAELESALVELLDSAERLVAAQAAVRRLLLGGGGGGAAPDAPHALSLRERQVLRLITRGLTNREIGMELDLAEKTVKNYVSALFCKLGVERRAQAAVVGAWLERAPERD
jgi:DNA-binding NarL/FixJ family response regulator